MSLVLALAFPSSLYSALLLLALVLGFGFVIFFHELGHFAAAKWVGIKVEQFAVGFGQALVSWRKGIGFRFGNTQKEYQRRLEEYVARKYKDEPHLLDKNSESYQQALIEAERALGLGETEYRLNWIPLGGYVKMLGQDDLRPNATAEDPRSYNRKSVGARMVVVSAGVVMNVILAGIGFMVLFMMGFHVPPAWVGTVASNSPAVNTVRHLGDAMRVSLQSGDQILEYQGKPQDDFTKIGLNVALSPEGVPQPIKVRHTDGSIEDLWITPRADDTSAGFLSLGITQPHTLSGLDPKEVDVDKLAKNAELQLPDMRSVDPGETITQIDGQDVKPDEYWKLDDALQNPQGKPVALTVRNGQSGQVRHTTISPHFTNPFGGGEVEVAGLTPRPMIPGIQEGSAAVGKVLPGDVVVSVSDSAGDSPPKLDTQTFQKFLRGAAEQHKDLKLVVLRNGHEVTIERLSANMKIETAKGQKSRGLGVQLGYDEMHPVVAATIKDSPADVAGIPAGATITAVGNRPIANWFDIERCLAEARPDAPIAVHFTTSQGPGEKQLVLNEDQIWRIKGIRHGNGQILLKEYIGLRKASSPAQAAYWGITETRDFILQFYLTLRRMAAGSVSPDQLMGPVGIFVGGARFAFKGWDWLLWFLSMISANLAVVNFLPIPIVDGGLFTFLILEKIQGRPLSPRTQAIAQYVGLAFLAGVFLFVTYHDILRFI